MDPQTIEPLTQFGVAGLMGLLWVWERRLSRRREEQLDEAHAAILAQRRQHDQLIELVQHNTQMIERFNQTVSQMKFVMEQLSHELETRQRAAG